jgi:hypothetical protein
VRRSKSSKFGTVVGRAKDHVTVIVLLDGNRDTIRVPEHKAEVLRPGDIGYHLKGHR